MKKNVFNITHTCFQLDLNDIDLERWREILPLAAELIHDDAEIMTQSPSQTVSIYEALAEILSKPTESLSFLNNNSTDRTLFSEAPSTTTTSTSSTTTTTTTSTTTSTTTTTTSKPPPLSTVAYDASKVDISSTSSASTPLITTPITKSTTKITEQRNKNTTTSAQISVNKTKTTLSIDPITNPSSTTPIPSSSIENIPTRISLDLEIMTTLTQNDTTTEQILTESTNIYETITTPSDLRMNETIINNITNNTEKFDLILTKNLTNPNIETNGKVKNLKISRFVNLKPNITLESLTSNKKIFQGHTKFPSIDLMTRKISKSNDYSTPSIFPVYRPYFKLITTTQPMTVSTIESLSTASMEMTTHSSEIVTKSDAELINEFFDENNSDMSTLKSDEILFKSGDKLTDKSFSDVYSTEIFTDTTEIVNEPELIEKLLYDVITTTEIPFESSTKTYFRRTFKMTTKSPFRSNLNTQTQIEAEDSTQFTPETSTYLTPDLINEDFYEATTKISPRIRMNKLNIQITRNNKMTTKTPYFEKTSTTTEIPLTTYFNYDAMTTVAQVSNPSPFKLPSSSSSRSIESKMEKIDKIIPLKKYPIYSENERYAILPNNTVIRKILRDDLHLNYGILPNGTVIKKDYDGNVMRVDDDTEITNIDPINLTKSQIKATNYLTITEQTKMVFYLSIFYV